MRDEESLRERQDGEIELDAAVLVYLALARRGGGDVRRDEIDLRDPSSCELCGDPLDVEHIPDEGLDPLVPERFDFLDVESYHAACGTDEGRDHLYEAPGRARDIEDDLSGLYEVVLFLDFEELKGAAGAVAETLCFEEVLVADDEGVGGLGF